MVAIFRYSYRLVTFIVGSLPPGIQRGIATVLGILWFDIFRIRRKLIFSNLDIAFPNMSRSEKTKIARKSCINMAMNLVEFCKFQFLSKADAHTFTFKGMENLIAAEAKGKGVCVLSLHLGNYDLATASFALVDRPLTVISKEFKLHWLNEEWFSMRRRLGTKFIAPRNSTYHILRALKDGQRIVFVMDQFMGPPIGVRTTFFGKETGTAMGLSVVAARTGAPVVPIFSFRDAQGRHHVHIEPEVAFEDVGDYNKSLAHMTQKYADIVESAIRNYPEQWLWVHRRWKKYKVAENTKYHKLKQWDLDSRA